MPRRPRVTVLMPVHDAAPFLREAVDSVLAQTWRDFELLLLDDGSRDDSGAICDAYAAADARVRVEHLPHRGLVATLNHGLDRIDTELIARADADDINLRQRLARQVGFMDARPAVGVCGSWVEGLTTRRLAPLPSASDELRALTLFITPIHHPTAMLRREWIARSGARFDPAFTHAEDYDFWERAAQLTELANIPAALLRYRAHAGQISARHRAAQLASAAAVRRRQLLALGLQPSAAELAIHEEVSSGAAGRSSDSLEAGRRWLEGLVEANRASRRYPEPAFTRVVAVRWYRNCAEALLRRQVGVSTLAASWLARELPNRWRHRARLYALRLLPHRLSRRAVQVSHRLRGN